MIPGSIIIKRCSACSKSIRQHTIASGNTFGATYWTDGKRDSPMLPDQPWLVICPHCRTPLWLDELEEVGELELMGGGHGPFKDALEYATPSTEDFHSILETGVGVPAMERYLRLRVWWSGNDKRRMCAGETPMSSRETSNLTAFAQTLDETEDNDLVMKAEVMRELGRFGDALSLLAKTHDEGLAHAVNFIRGLALASDPCVRELRFD